MSSAYGSFLNRGKGNLVLRFGIRPVKFRPARMPSSVLVVFVAAIGCGGPPAIEVEPFRQTRSWRLESVRDDASLKGIELRATLSPDPVKAHKPAMLEVRFDTAALDTKWRPRVWYRFAFRRGDRQPNDVSLVRPPETAHEEGVEPRYDDWFEWAEIIEPRAEPGGLVFDTPVMLDEGKVYIQFRVEVPSDRPPLELLDWFVYVNKFE